MVAFAGAAVLIAVWAVTLVATSGEPVARGPGVSYSDFDRLQLGASRTEVHRRFGVTITPADPAAFGAVPAGVSCEFYPRLIEAELPIPGFLGEVRFCFREARLVAKAMSDGICVRHRSAVAAIASDRPCPR